MIVPNPFTASNEVGDRLETRRSLRSEVTLQYFLEACLAHKKENGTFLQADCLSRKKSAVSVFKPAILEKNIVRPSYWIKSGAGLGKSQLNF